MNNEQDNETMPVKHTQVIAVSSGKGGVGKTFLSVHLAAHAARQGRRVLLIDADLGLANIDIMLGLTARKSIQQAIDGDNGLKEIIVTVEENLDLLPAGSGLHQLDYLTPSQRSNLLDDLDEVIDHYDLVISDTGAGIGENVLFFTSSSEMVLVVLTPDPTALTDAYALIKVLSQHHQTRHFMVAVNQSSEVSAHMIFQRLLTVANRYLDVELHYVGYMPETASVREAIQSQQLLYASSNTQAITCMHKLAETILSQPRQQTASSHSGMQFAWQRTMSEDLNNTASSEHPA